MNKANWEFTIAEDRTGPAFTPVLTASLQAGRKVEPSRFGETKTRAVLIALTRNLGL
ncbi:hypothetical protein Srufu_070270 [Streptomyces libani subsp. rufus]|nr:hypothetical protein Srufu_070270 [Streptomyces libani subsp. rufus]